MRVLIYARVSRDPKRLGRSVEEQVAECVAWAQREDWQVGRIVQETGSASRFARTNRQLWTEVLAAVEAGDIDALLTWEASRATRDLTAYAALRDMCATANVQWGYNGRLYNLQERDSRFRTGLDALLAEDEAARTSERVRRAVRENARKGRPHGKQIYGYLRIYDETTRELVKIIPHPEQGLIVREAATRVLNGESCYAIAKSFNERAIPPRRAAYRSQRDVLGWTLTAIKQMLAMPAYAGLRQHQGEILGEADWPPLIEPLERWEKLQTILHDPSRGRRNDWSARHLLAGIAVCHICGAGLRVGKQNYGRSGDQERVHYATYVCSGAPGRSGFHVTMKETTLDETVTAAVLARLERPDILDLLSSRDEGRDDERAALLAEIKQQREWLERVRQRATAEHNLDLLFDQEARVKPIMDAARKRLNSLIEADPSVVSLIEAGDIATAWERLDLATRRQVIRALVVPRVDRIHGVWTNDPRHSIERVKLQWK